MLAPIRALAQQHQHMQRYSDRSQQTVGCGAPLTAMSKSDSAYLNGLYKLNLGGSLRAQKDAIAFEIRTRWPHPDSGTADYENKLGHGSPGCYPDP